MKRTDEYYSDLKLRLQGLLGSTSHLLSPRKVAEVDEFVRFAEYGVALVWLANLLVEGGIEVSPEIRDQFVALADTMDIVEELPAELRGSG